MAEKAEFYDSNNRHAFLAVGNLVLKAERFMTSPEKLTGVKLGIFQTADISKGQVPQQVSLKEISNVAALRDFLIKILKSDKEIQDGR